jgi:predicted nuclease of predicted toxin-antitoxin system
VKFVVDESLSRRVAELLVGAGHDATHVLDLRLGGAVDGVVMRAAADMGATLISADTDFGELLAIGRHPGPSVVLLRRAPRRPADQARLLLQGLPDVEGSLERGAVVVLTPGRARVRLLPLGPQ